MKLRVTKPDGTVIDVEGTPEECERFAPPPPVVSPRYDGLPVRFDWPQPSVYPHPWWRDGEVISVEVACGARG